jgi:DNA polymerase-1
MQNTLKVLFVDGNSLGHTSHHVGEPRYVGDMQTQAIYNFLRSLHFKLSEDPAFVPVVSWDGRAQFRYDLHPEYKSSRNKTEVQRAAREAYTAQVPPLQKLLKHLGVLQIKAPFAEADDLGYQVSRLFLGTPHHLELYSGDTDWLQLVSENVVFRTVRRTGERVTFEDFAAATGYATPRQFIEGKALKGDTADDIEGIAGIGDVTATKILARFGSLTGFYAEVEAGNVALDRKAYRELAKPESRALWERNVQLMDLSLAPKISVSDLQIAPGSFNPASVERWCSDLDLGYYARNPEVLSRPFEAVAIHKAQVLDIINRL